MINNIFKLLENENDKIWVMYNSDGIDKIFKKYFFQGLDTKTICFVSPKKIYLAVSKLDSDNVKKINDKNVEVFVYKNTDELANIIEDIVSYLHFPKKILLSYSTILDKEVDILSHGEYLNLTKILRVPYKKYNKKVKFSSAENIIYEIISKKTDKEIERLKRLAKITDDVLSKTFNFLKVGMTEKEIVELTHKILDENMGKIVENKKDEIVSYKLAWQNCPIVLIGENLTKDGHSLPSDKKLEYGNTIYFDFGINAIYNDGERLFTDMQRMGYASKTDCVPKKVTKVFNTLINSIEDGIDEMKPGVKGYVVDNLVRGEILKAGYPDYYHATGHSVGLAVHDSGAIISLKMSKRANIKLVENGVYTLEPRIAVSNGGSIEEMIQVTKYGGIPISPLQKELYIISK